MSHRTVFRRYGHVLIYGLSMALFLVVLRWMELRFVIIDNAYNIYVGFLALLFTGLGIWLAMRLSKPKTVVVEKQVFVAPEAFEPNNSAIGELGISERELDVLKLMAAGRSNQEIASELFVSLNTIKTHTKNIFEKLGAARRTEAVNKARKLGIVA